MIVADEKHGTAIYVSALVCLRHRLDEGFWYDEDTAEKGEEAWNAGEEAAWEFLRNRRNAEYEYVERQEATT